MEPKHAFSFRHNFLKNFLVRVLSFAVLVLAVRFAFLVTLKGGSCNSGEFCFFPETLNFHISNGIAALGDLSSTQKPQTSVDTYTALFQDLIVEGSLSPGSRALCIETPTGEDVIALRQVGVFDSVGLFKIPSPPLIVYGEGHRQSFEDNTFDFEFSGNGGLDTSGKPVEFASEICRTLKPGGFFVIHSSAGRDTYSFHSLLSLFNCCRLIRSREFNGFREFVMKKDDPFSENNGKKSSSGGNSANQCSVLGYKDEIIQNAEPLIAEEPLKPWVTLKRNLNSIKYITSMVDISFKNKYAYIDVGARSYGSSIGSWFMKQYPKQKKDFEVYAIEADKAFHGEYRKKKGVNLLPYAAWLRNETLFFEITRDPRKKLGERGRGMGRIHPVQTSSSYMGDMDKIQGFDFANWLKKTFSERDFVVMKMDVEGAEFHLIPKMIQSGAICLVDELFLECHYNRWQKCCPGKRSPKYEKSYAQCLHLLTSLRQNGVLVHQWW